MKKILFKTTKWMLICVCIYLFSIFVVIFLNEKPEMLSSYIDSNIKFLLKAEDIVSISSAPNNSKLNASVLFSVGLLVSFFVGIFKFDAAVFWAVKKGLISKLKGEILIQRGPILLTPLILAVAFPLFVELFSK